MGLRCFMAFAASALICLWRPEIAQVAGEGYKVEAVVCLKMAGPDWVETHRVDF